MSNGGERMKTVSKVFFVLFLSVLFVGLSFTAQAKEKPIKVGIVLPLTGPKAMFGEMEKNSFLMAYKDLGKKTVIGGRKIELLFEDGQGNPSIAKAAAEKLVHKDKVVMLSGGYSSACTYPIAGAAQSMKVPFLVTTGAADKITTQGWKWVFRGTAAPASKYTGALFDFYDRVVHPKTAALMYENTDFGTSSAKGFRQICKKKGIKIVFDEAYEAGAVDFKPMLAKAKKSNPDTAYCISYVMDAALIATQMKELNWNCPFFVGGAAGWTMPEFLKNAGDASQYIASTTLWVPNVAWPGAKEYYDNYVKKYGKKPDYHGAQAYATMQIIVAALNNAKKITPDEIRKALLKTEVNTIMGPIKFENWSDEFGHHYTNQNKPTTYVVQWQNGRLEVIWPEAAKSANYVYPVPEWSKR